MRCVSLLLSVAAGMRCWTPPASTAHATLTSSAMNEGMVLSGTGGAQVVPALQAAHAWRGAAFLCSGSAGQIRPCGESPPCGKEAG